MGDKGVKKGGEADAAATALLEDLQPLGAVRRKPMFGGHGIFLEDLMFAIVDPAGRCLLRADDQSSASYEAAGAQKHGRMPYWTIPDAVRSDPDELLNWARAAHAAAVAAKR